MNLEPRIDVIANALADQTRAAIACALMDGRAFTAKELAHGAGVTPQTASFHLRILSDSGIISVIKSGRSKYHRLAGTGVAQVIESMACLAGPDHIDRLGPTGVAQPLRTARSCYDHLAGGLATTIADTLQARGLIEFSERESTVTPDGEAFFRRFGIDADELRKRKRPLIRCCLDWTERRYHVAGSLGAALLDMMLDNAWLERRTGDRCLAVTPVGRAALMSGFGLDSGTPGLGSTDAAVRLA